MVQATGGVSAWDERKREQAGLLWQDLFAADAVHINPTYESCHSFYFSLFLLCLSILSRLSLLSILRLLLTCFLPCRLCPYHFFRPPFFSDWDFFLGPLFFRLFCFRFFSGSVFLNFQFLNFSHFGDDKRCPLVGRYLRLFFSIYFWYKYCPFFPFYSIFRPTAVARYVLACDYRRDDISELT